MKIANINKVYHGPYIINRIGTEYVYVQGGTTPPAPTGCPTVVDDITQYQGSDSEVYDLSTGKWYERNNLNQYEEYGILETVQDLTNTTYYPGKLVYYNSHEYESINGQWVDLGSAGTSITIQSPTYIYNGSGNMFTIPLDYTGSTDSKWQIRFSPKNNGGGAILGDTGNGDDDDYRIFWSGTKAYFDIENSRINAPYYYNFGDYYLEYGNYYIRNLKSGSDIATGATKTFQRTTTMSLGVGTQDLFQFSALTMYHGNDVVRDFIPAIDDNEICLYDKVSNQYFKSNNGAYPLSGGTIEQVQVGTISPIKTYTEKQSIATAVTVNSLSEIDCPFEGLVAHVGNDTYIYTNGQWVQQAYNYQPLVITTAEKSFLLPNFDIYAGRDSKVTEVAILANIANQTTNVRFVNTQISEPWRSAYGWGLWRESGYFAPKPIGETWFKSTTTLSNYTGSIYWFVVDSYGNFKIYAGTSGDTVPTGTPVYTFNNKTSVSSSYQLTTNDVRFFGTGGDYSDSAVKNSTIYRVNINDGNATYTGSYIPILESGGTQYMLNTTTNTKYEINIY